MLPALGRPLYGFAPWSAGGTRRREKKAPGQRGTACHRKPGRRSRDDKGAGRETPTRAAYYRGPLTDGQGRGMMTSKRRTARQLGRAAFARSLLSKMAAAAGGAS